MLIIIAQPSTPTHLLSNLNLSPRPHRKFAFKQHSHSRTPPPGSLFDPLRERFHLRNLFPSQPERRLFDPFPEELLTVKTYPIFPTILPLIRILRVHLKRYLPLITGLLKESTDLHLLGCLLVLSRVKTRLSRKSQLSSNRETSVLFYKYLSAK